VLKDCEECLNKGNKEICGKCWETSGGRPSKWECKGVGRNPILIVKVPITRLPGEG